MSDAFVRLDGVTKRFRERTIVDAVSFDIGEGEIVALLGASGCGKTTLLRLIAGLETPDAGEIWIAGERVAADGCDSVPPRARGLGFVFQDLALWSHLTVAGNLRFVLRCAKLSKPEQRERIDEALRITRIERFAESYPDHLSGGEQQRVAIARALVGRPRLLLLDEPMSSLDTELKGELLAELATLQQQLGVTSLYITHDHAEARALAHRVILMRAGRVERVEMVDRTLPVKQKGSSSSK
ncbi:MAG: ABC transporter ATP-binding protein [Pyrinomonadaceae bacterium]|nr:ABC transporter ATP-binding protein [Pyrinomonadaceae bacterium]